MKIKDLYERRRNPELNKKETLIDIIKRHANNPNIFIHTTNINKMGYNPKYANVHNTPFGIYTLNLQTVISTNLPNIDEDEYETDNDILSRIEFFGGKHVFFVEADIEKHTNETYTTKMFIDDINKLYKMFSYEAVDMAESVATEEIEEGKQTPLESLYYITKYLSSYMKHKTIERSYFNDFDVKNWTKILIALGFDYIDDSNGFMHSEERFQTVFFKKIYNIVDYYFSSPKQVPATVRVKTFVEFCNKYYSGDLKYNNVKTLYIDHNNATIPPYNELPKPYIMELLKNTIIIYNRFTINDIGWNKFYVDTYMKQHKKTNTISNVTFEHLILEHGNFDKDDLKGINDFINHLKDIGIKIKKYDIPDEYKEYINQ